MHEDPPVVEHIVHPLPARHHALDGTRIVQVSDLHVGRYMRAEHWAAHIERINALAPHLVVITGDAMDWARRYEADFLEPLASLRPEVAALAILGNHDFYFGGERLAAGYRRSGTVRVLRGERWHSDALPGLSVWGIDDPMTALAARAPYGRLAGWASSLDRARYNLLLSHRPDAFHHAPSLGFDLQLSGHTHGGQIVVSAPWGRRWHVASVLGPWDQGSFEVTVQADQHAGFQAAFSGSAPASECRGVYAAYMTRPSADVSPDQSRLGSRPLRAPERLPFEMRRSRLYVSRGLGFAGVPYRRRCPTEITVHELSHDAPALAAAS